nr:MAG TPA: Protein of unknown function (DUF1040) [Caudoviricetes sp.]
MRLKERIPILWKLFKNNKERVISYLVGEENLTETLVRLEEKPYLKELWEENQDWRFVQLLTNCCVLNPSVGFYYTEDERLFINMGLIDARDIYFWRNNYDKKGNLLKNPCFSTISEITTEHLLNIIKHHEENGFYISNFYLILISLEIEIRRVKEELKKGELTESEAKSLTEGLILEQNK